QRQLIMRDLVHDPFQTLRRRSLFGGDIRCQWRNDLAENLAPQVRGDKRALAAFAIALTPREARARRPFYRHSPGGSEISVESSDFAASLEARREMWLATSSSGSPNDG